MGRRLAVLGATGRTGRLVVEQALRAGHTVRALVRAPARGGVPDRVHLITGDVRDDRALAEVVAGTDAVVSCLGVTLSATLIQRDAVLAACMQHVVAAMRAHGPRRLVALSTYGAGDSWPRLTRGARLLMATLLRRELADKNAMETAIAASDLDWTIVRPVNLRDGPAAGGHWLVDPPGPVGIRAWIPRAEVAGFVLAALDDPTTVRRACLLAASGA